MSYCRWSSDDFDCDVYAYADISGAWITHVAAKRVAVDRSSLPPLADDLSIDGWIRRHDAVMALVKDAERVPIGLPHDGESFSDPTPGACADRLESLRQIGYHVPQYAIDALREEESDDARRGRGR